MAHAYDENLLNKAQITLANMLDTAVNTYGYDLQVFYMLFLKSKYCKSFKEINEIANISDFKLMYSKYHEMDIMQLVEFLENKRLKL